MREVERFRCLGDGGKTYVVVARAEQIRFQPLRGPVQYHDGPLDLVLDDGSDVTPVDEPRGIYQILLTDEIIRRVG
jgi:hypothetical protein